MVSEFDRVHQRLDELLQSQAALQKTVAELKGAIDTNNALCATCRPKVLGNGKEGYDARIARIEEARTVSKSFILGMVSVAGAVGAVMAALPKLLELASKYL